MRLISRARRTAAPLNALPTGTVQGVRPLHTDEALLGGLPAGAEAAHTRRTTGLRNGVMSMLRVEPGGAR